MPLKRAEYAYLFLTKSKHPNRLYEQAIHAQFLSDLQWSSVLPLNGSPAIDPQNEK